MKHIHFVLLFICISLSGCEIVGGIFKAGVGVGVFLVIVVVALILWLLSKFRNR